jgi:hypothetical protein
MTVAFIKSSKVDFHSTNLRFTQFCFSQFSGISSGIAQAGLYFSTWQLQLPRVN